MALCLMCITAMTLFAALATPAQLAVHPATMNYPRFKLIDLGTFGGSYSFVNGPLLPILSSNGTYGGQADTSIRDPFAPNCQNPDCLVQRAQQWQNGVVTDLGTLPGTNLSSGATWVSANGTIVGESENGLIDPLLGIPELRAVLWTGDGQITDLGTMEGGDWSFGGGVNNRGQVTVFAANKTPDPFNPFGFPFQTRTFLWQHGVMQDLGSLGGPDALMYAINERGQIAGISYTNSIPNPVTGIPTLHPFLWENGTMMDLGTLGGTLVPADWRNSRGQVVGTSTSAGDQTHDPSCGTAACFMTWARSAGLMEKPIGLATLVSWLAEPISRP
jgi:probable HAF family extracellular repeat protein